MTDILYIAQVLHDDDYIMGILSEKSFYVSLNSVGSRVHYSDAFSSLSLFSVPRAGDLAPDCDEVRIMSPEMCAFISTQNETETEAYQLNLSPASDVFALGMLYHLILTGRYPQVNTISQFDETKPYATYSNAICHALHPEQAIVLDHSLDRKHSELIRRMIALDPLDRISDCGQIANIIMSFYTE